VVVIGLGAMGLMHVQVMSAMGVQKIIGIDPIVERRVKAATFGAYLTLDPNEVDVVAELKKITGNLGVDLIFVCAGGSAQTKVTQEALQAVRKKGRIMLYASALKPAEIPLDINHIHYSMIHLSGTVGFYPRHGHAALELLQQGKISVEAIRTPRIPFNHFIDAFTISMKSDVTKAGIELFDA
jgi:threonine dehydrogenase-like Zn-dependent dehydrogenase